MAEEEEKARTNLAPHRCMSRAADRALLVDFDGVLRIWPRLGEDLGIPEPEIQRAAFAPALLREAVTGALSDEAWRDRIASVLSVKYGDRLARAAVARWSLPCGVIVPEIAALLRRIAPNVRVVLATNATSRLPRDLQALGLSGLFDSLANSSEIGHAKPDMEFFQAALSLAGISARKALFVDDAAENVAAASALGIAAHHFKSAGLMEQFLREQGVLPRHEL
jgi:putative hydrolase of the HAD superfamily